MISIVLIIAALILLNAFFVAAEFAIVGAPRAAIAARAARKQPLARLVQSILREPRRQDRYIATSQIGVTAASLGLGMYAEHALAGWILEMIGTTGMARWLAAHGIASVAAVAILTYFHIVLGEMVPKSMVLRSAEQVVLWITPLMLWIQTVLLPLVVVLNRLGSLVLKLVGIERQAHNVDQYYTSEELQLIVQESEERGALRFEASQMLQELFEFGDRTAGEVMVPRVRITGIPVGASGEELRALLREDPHTRYPIYETDLDHIIGMYHIKDLLGLLLVSRPLSASGVRQIPMIPETARLDTVLATMRREWSQLAVVIDEHGGTAGIITLEDLFEEVVGEIDEGPESAVPRFDLMGRLIVAGTMRLDELERFYDLELAHKDVDSISGLILTLLGRPPQVGDSVQYERLKFEVTAVKGHGVNEAAVSPVS